MIELAPEHSTKYDPERDLNSFEYDPDFEQHEEYGEIRKKIHGDARDSDEEDGGTKETPVQCTFAPLLYSNRLLLT